VSMAKREHKSTREEVAYNLAKDLLKVWKGQTPREVVTNLLLSMSESQINEFIGVTNDEGESTPWRIGPSTIRGNGVFSKVECDENTALFPVLDLSEIKKTVPMNHLQHSEDPNIEVRGVGTNAYACSVKKISEGDELTLNYPELPWLMLFDRNPPGPRRVGGEVPPVSTHDESEDG